MATIVDSLIVTLGLDGKDFEKGAKKAEKAQEELERKTTKSKKRMSEEEKKVATEEKKLEDERKRREKAAEDRAKKIAGGFIKMRNEALAFFTVLAVGSGLKSFVENTIASASGLDRLSANLDMSAKDLAEYQLAAKHAGGTVEGMTAQLKQSANDVAKFKMGLGSDSLSWFFRMGGSTDDLKDGNTYLMARADIIKKIYDVDPTKARVVAESMGISEDQFNLLKQGSAAVEQQRKAQSALAEEMARASKPAEELRKEMDAMGNTYQSVSVNVLTALLPSFRIILDKLKDFGEWVASHKDEISGFVSGMVEGVTVAANAIVPLLTLIADGWKNIWSWAKAAGEMINKVLPQSWKDKIGEMTAKGLAYFGGKEAQNAVASTEGGSRSSNARPLFAGLEKKYGLPSGLLDSVWSTESGRGTKMRSPAGAMGHFQFMPPTAKQYGLKNPDDLNESADAAARMYRDLLRQNGGDLPRALAGYNWGQGNLQQKGFGSAPKETRDYIDRVLGGMGRSNALAAAGMPMGAQATAPANTMKYGGSPSSTVSSETHIGQITIQTAATDANGIAKDAQSAFQRYAFASQSNTGLN